MNRVRGNSVLEAAQKAQSKELGEEPANRNPEAVASDDTPLMVTFQEKEESPDAQDPEVDTDVKRFGRAGSGEFGISAWFGVLPTYGRSWAMTIWGKGSRCENRVIDSERRYEEGNHG